MNAAEYVEMIDSVVTAHIETMLRDRPALRRVALDDFAAILKAGILVGLDLVERVEGVSS